ncbi:MAG: hypothetical protein ACKN9U_14130, partial [Pirellulaceae bacterium]
LPPTLGVRPRAGAAAIEEGRLAERPLRQCAGTRRKAGDEQDMSMVEPTVDALLIRRGLKEKPSR